VHLRDVAKVVNGVENDQLAAWADGKPAVLLDIRRQPGANIIQTVEHIRSILPQLKSVLPAGVHLGVFADPGVTPEAFEERVTSVRAESGIDRTAAVDALEAALSEWADADPGDWANEELARAEEIAANRFERDDWTRRR